jgi:tetratricopeptide (TPR) repeat protein
LPAPSGGPELPARPGGAELPAPSGRADLPASASASPELPGVRNIDLPASKSSDDDLFAAPASSDDDLFGPPGGGSGNDDLFGAPAGDSGDDDLFGAPAGDSGDDDLFGAPAGDSGDDDLFGAPAGDSGDDDLFGAPDDDDDDLFGTPDDDDDDLFGTPDDDDLFGSDDAGDDDLFGSPADDDGDDLFGTPVGGPGAQQAADPEPDDLFGGGASDDDDLFDAPIGSDPDDFLGGDGGFSFLDDEPPPADAPDWDDDLFGDDEPAAPAAPQADDWGDELLAEAETKPKPKPRQVESIYDENDPFRPASSGIKEDEPLAPETAEAPQATEKEPLGNKLVLVAVAAGIVAFAGVGWVIYSNFFSGEETVEKPTVVPTTPTDIDLAQLKADNYGDFDRFLGAKGLSGADGEAKMLLVESLALAKYDAADIRQRADGRAAKYADASEGVPALARGAYEAQAGNADAARAYLEPLAGGNDDVAYFANLFMGIGDVKAVLAEIDKSGLPKGAEPANPEPQTPEPQPVAGDADAGTPDADAGAVAEAPEPEPEPEPAKPAFGGLADRARAALNAAATKSADSPAPHYWIGRLDAALGETDDALAAYTKAVDKMESHVPSQLELGRMHYRLGDLNDAIDHLEQVSGPLQPFAHVSETADAYHIAGMLHVARRQSDLAIEAFTKALNADPSRSDTLSALAEEYESAQKYQEALNFFTTNKSLGQNNPEVILGIVRSHIGLEQWNQAITQLEEGQKAFPDDARFPFYLGQLHLRRGAFFDAKKALERAIEIDPGLLTAQANLAKLAWRMDKDVVKGEEYVAEIVKRPDGIDAEVAAEVADYYADSDRSELAEQWYRMALKVDPNYWGARLSLSKLLLDQGRFEDATTLLERARDEGVQDIRLQAYLADAYRQANQFDRAIEAINKVIAEYPKNEEYVFIRGRIHFDRGNYETAREDFNRAYELNPRFHDAYFYVGRTAHATGDFSTALKIFRHVLDYMPERGDFHYFMAMTLEELNRTAQALDEYRKATAVDPEFGRRDPLVYIRRGRLLSRMNYTVEGRRDIERALEIAPDRLETRIAMGELEYKDKNYAAAIDHFETALEKNAEQPQAQYQLGMSLIYSGKRQAGAKRLQLAIKHGYDDPEVYRTLGYTYKELGQRALAVQSFRTYLEKAAGDGLPAATTKEMLRQIDELGG